MPPFPKPKFQYTYDVSAEINHLRQHKLTRGVPAKAQDRLLIARWNIENFGVQERTGDDRQLIAEVIGWFDAFAVQETHVSPSSTTAPNSLCWKKSVRSRSRRGTTQRFRSRASRKHSRASTGTRTSRRSRLGSSQS